MKIFTTATLVLLFSISASIATAGGWEKLEYRSKVNESKARSIISALQECVKLGYPGDKIEIKTVPSASAEDYDQVDFIVTTICGIH